MKQCWKTTEKQLRTVIGNALVEHGVTWTEPTGEIRMYLREDSFDDMINMVIEEVDELWSQGQ